MPDDHEVVVDKINDLLGTIEQQTIDESEEFPMLADDLRETLSALAQKLIILRDRITEEETNYVMAD